MVAGTSTANLGERLHSEGRRLCRPGAIGGYRPRVDSPEPMRRARFRLPSLLGALLMVSLSLALLAPSLPPAREGTGVAAAGHRPASVDPPGVSVERGLRYGASPAMVLDVHRRGQRARRLQPAVLVIHGGGWTGGDKRRMAGVASALALAGFVALNINYSLAAPWRPGFPKQLNELRRAVRWTRRNAERLGVDRAHIGALGSSAGGHLAALLAVRTRGPLSRGDRVGAVASWSGPLDVARGGDPSLAPAVRTFLGCPAQRCPRQGVAASPSSHVTRDDPPLLIVHSQRELVPVDHARGMAARLSRAGVPHRLWILPGSEHAMVYAGTAIGPSIAFLRRRLR